MDWLVPPKCLKRYFGVLPFSGPFLSHSKGQMFAFIHPVPPPNTHPQIGMHFTCFK